jgi:predicted secreted acid phosphatase
VNQEKQLERLAGAVAFANRAYFHGSQIRFCSSLSIKNVKGDRLAAEKLVDFGY